MENKFFVVSGTIRLNNNIICKFTVASINEIGCIVIIKNIE